MEGQTGLPAAASLLGPEDTASNPVTYTWEAVPAASWYYLWVNDGSGNKIKSWYTAADCGCGAGTGQCAVTPAATLNAGGHTWWIRTWNDNGYGSWSAGLSFAIADSTGNTKPVAESLTLNVDSTTPYIEKQLSADDADGDTLVYELVSPAAGTGYSSAYINSDSGMLYITLEAAGSDRTFSLEYRVTDGRLYSDTATVTVSVTYLSEEDKETGQEEVDPREYSTYDLSTYNSDLLGGDNPPSIPGAIDLSGNFPTPGDQGAQGSCVGWATAYALKSYQEKLEIGWSLNTAAHLFSPAYVYNQIVLGNDGGSYIPDALNLAVNQGIATLATMPYSDQDYWTQPSATAVSEASQYKAASWHRVNDTSQIKAALINRKPVVCGITVYSSFYSLSGTGAVYNTASGQNEGGHAVTIVGYDDNKYGGAFKVINSWSPNWGDGGYFWLPYDFARDGIMSEAYVLEDAENSVPTDPQEPTEPEPDYSTLPNLSVASWNASYDPRPKGSGVLTYTVTNSGTGTAFAGADINLMLSTNTTITSSDYYVVYEEIVFDLDSGDSVYRDEDNALSFCFPDGIPPGTYYMALWVDDLDEVVESNEGDNVSRGDRTVSIYNSLPDLSVNTWYANWDGSGNGTLTYEVENRGASATATSDWWINLILDADQTLGNGNEIFLFYEQAQYYLDPGDSIYRDEGNPAYFNMFADYLGNSVPAGEYYMGLWVDDLDSVSESNELNNGSYSWGTVAISYAASPSRALLGNQGGREKAVEAGQAYNGKRLPADTEKVYWKKIVIPPKDGGVSRHLLEKGVSHRSQATPTPPLKQNESGAGLIFPAAERFPMPEEGARYDK